MQWTRNYVEPELPAGGNPPRMKRPSGEGGCAVPAVMKREMAGTLRFARPTSLGLWGYRHGAWLATTDHQHTDRTDRRHGGDRHHGQREAAGLGLDPADQVVEEETRKVAERVDLRPARRGRRR